MLAIAIYQAAQMTYLQRLQKAIHADGRISEDEKQNADAVLNGPFKQFRTSLMFGSFMPAVLVAHARMEAEGLPEDEKMRHAISDGWKIFFDKRLMTRTFPPEQIVPDKTQSSPARRSSCCAIRGAMAALNACTTTSPPIVRNCRWSSAAQSWQRIKLNPPAIRLSLNNAGGKPMTLPPHLPPARRQPMRRPWEPPAAQCPFRHILTRPKEKTEESGRGGLRKKLTYALAGALMLPGHDALTQTPRPQGKSGQTWVKRKQSAGHQDRDQEPPPITGGRH